MGSSTPALDTLVKRTGEKTKRAFEPRDRRPAPRPGGDARGRAAAACSDAVGRKSARRMDGAAFAALVLFGLIVIAAVAGPLLSPHPVDTIDPANKLLPPTWSHPFGTDDMGRDLFVRVMVGGRFTIAVAVTAVLFALLVGMIGGGAAGFYGGRLGAVVMRAADLMLSIPVLLVLLLFSSVFSPGFLLLCLLIGSVQWMEVARIVRSVVLSTKENEYVDAARALGLSNNRILVRHILPHTGGPMLVAATLGLAQAILIESTISFFGFGLQPPAVSWGALLRNAQGYLSSAPWVAVSPGMMILATVLCCYVLSGAVSSVFDPRRAVRGPAWGGQTLR